MYNILQVFYVYQMWMSARQRLTSVMEELNAKIPSGHTSVSANPV